MTRKLTDLTDDDLREIVNTEISKFLHPLVAPGGSINTLMGTFGPGAGSVFTSGGTPGSKEYFQTHRPSEYSADAAARPAFLQFFGKKGLAMLNAWGIVVGHRDAQFQPAAEQLEFFREDGTRAYYTVSDLRLMLPENRKAVCSNFLDGDLRVLAGDRKLWVTDEPGILTSIKPG